VQEGHPPLSPHIELEGVGRGGTQRSNLTPAYFRPELNNATAGRKKRKKEKEETTETTSTLDFKAAVRLGGRREGGGTKRGKSLDSDSCDEAKGKKFGSICL